MSILKNLADHDEVARYEEALARYLDLELDAEHFTAIRLQHGIYGQRQEGVNMVRIKLPGGRLDPSKLETLAEVAEDFAPLKLVHITTRQDLQMHHVPLGETGQVMRRLAADGITTREACGNTVRNITTCPLAGVCPREHVDVTTHLEGAVAHLLRNPQNQQMPRKFKISFSGCEADCAQGLIQDLAFIATRRDGQPGFKVLAAGGLGHKPYAAITLAEFIGEEDLYPVIDAVIALHNKYSDRTKRARSRIKFLVGRFGEAGFIERFQEELARTRAALADVTGPRGDWQTPGEGPIPGYGAPRQVFAQKQAGLHVVPISAPQGQLTAAQLAGLAARLGERGLRDVRTTQDQNLIILDVPQSQIEALGEELAQLGLKQPAAGDDVVSCPGASTCRLGITTSMLVAPKLTGGKHDLRIRVSGCTNGCAQPETGDIGIYGEGKRLHGKLIPHYQMYFGGKGSSAGGSIAIKGPSIPSARIEKAVARVEKTYDEERAEGESFYQWAQRQSTERFQSLLADLIQVSRFELNKLARDHGDSDEFRVVSTGGGECASDTGSALVRGFLKAAHERSYREAFTFQKKFADASACAEAQLKLVAAALAGLADSEDLAASVAVLRTLTFLQPLADRLGELGVDLARLDPADETELKRIFGKIDEWIIDAAQQCQAQDAQLDLHGTLPPPAQTIARPAPLLAS